MTCVSSSRLTVRLVVITGTAPRSLHLCAELARHHEVAVIHVNGGGPSESRLRKVRRLTRGYGLAHVAMRAATKFDRLTGWTPEETLARSERAFFADAAERFHAEIGRDRVYRVEDVNGPETVGLVTRLGPEAVVCLGGPVYRRPLIDASPLMLNFHSGVSPLYNGANSIAFAFANGHPHLCGGTAMVMGTIVDGGDILAHVLPEIRPDDSPTTLFLRTVSTAPEVYLRILAHIARGGNLTACPQPPALFYTRGFEWTIAHTRAVRRHLSQGTAAAYMRPASLVEYWKMGSQQRARKVLADTIVELLGLT